MKAGLVLLLAPLTLWCGSTTVLFQPSSPSVGPYPTNALTIKTDLQKTGLQMSLPLTLAIAAGLQAVHNAGIVHRDLKTPNVMRDSHGVVRLMDFGIAKEINSDASGVTGTGMSLGTPEYMSPEQASARPIRPSK